METFSALSALLNCSTLLPVSLKTPGPTSISSPCVLSKWQNEFEGGGWREKGVKCLLQVGCLLRARRKDAVVLLADLV